MKKGILFGLTLLLFAGCFGNDEEEEKKEEKSNGEETTVEISCTDYIKDYLGERNWENTNGTIFANTENPYLVWNLSSNVVTIMEDDGNTSLFLNNDQIFTQDDFTTDRFEELNEELDYATYQELANQVYEHLDGLGCPLRGKEMDILEEYEEVMIDN